MRRALIVLVVQAWAVAGPDLQSLLQPRSNMNQITVDAWAKAPKSAPTRLGPQAPGARPKDEAKPDEPRANPKKEERTRLV